jgi:hypothetical protein
MWLDEALVPVWKAGEVAPAGNYVRIDNRSYHLVTLDQPGPLPASFDGRVALYRAASPRSLPRRPAAFPAGSAAEDSGAGGRTRR